MFHRLSSRINRTTPSTELFAFFCRRQSSSRSDSGTAGSGRSRRDQQVNRSSSTGGSSTPVAPSLTSILLNTFLHRSATTTTNSTDTMIDLSQSTATSVSETTRPTKNAPATTLRDMPPPLFSQLLTASSTTNPARSLSSHFDPFVQQSHHQSSSSRSDGPILSKSSFLHSSIQEKLQEVMSTSGGGGYGWGRHTTASSWQLQLQDTAALVSHAIRHRLCCTFTSANFTRGGEICVTGRHHSVDTAFDCLWGLLDAAAREGELRSRTERKLALLTVVQGVMELWSEMTHPTRDVAAASQVGDATEGTRGGQRQQKDRSDTATTSSSSSSSSSFTLTDPTTASAGCLALIELFEKGSPLDLVLVDLLHHTVEGEGGSRQLAVAACCLPSTFNISRLVREVHSMDTAHCCFSELCLLAAFLSTFGFRHGAYQRLGLHDRLVDGGDSAQSSSPSSLGGSSSTPSTTPTSTTSTSPSSLFSVKVDWDYVEETARSAFRRVTLHLELVVEHHRQVSLAERRRANRQQQRKPPTSPSTGSTPSSPLPPSPSLLYTARDVSLLHQSLVQVGHQLRALGASSTRTTGEKRRESFLFRSLANLLRSSEPQQSSLPSASDKGGIQQFGMNRRGRGGAGPVFYGHKTKLETTAAASPSSLMEQWRMSSDDPSSGYYGLMRGSGGGSTVGVGAAQSSVYLDEYLFTRVLMPVLGEAGTGRESEEHVPVPTAQAGTKAAAASTHLTVDEFTQCAHLVLDVAPTSNKALSLGAGVENTLLGGTASSRHNVAGDDATPHHSGLAPSREIELLSSAGLLSALRTAVSLRLHVMTMCLLVEVSRRLPEVLNNTLGLGGGVVGEFSSSQLKGGDGDAIGESTALVPSFSSSSAPELLLLLAAVGSCFDQSAKSPTSSVPLEVGGRLQLAHAAAEIMIALETALQLPPAGGGGSAVADQLWVRCPEVALMLLKLVQLSTPLLLLLVTEGGGSKHPPRSDVAAATVCTALLQAAAGPATIPHLRSVIGGSVEALLTTWECCSRVAGNPTIKQQPPHHQVAATIVNETQGLLVMDAMTRSQNHRRRLLTVATETGLLSPFVAGDIAGSEPEPYSRRKKVSPTGRNNVLSPEKQQQQVSSAATSVSSPTDRLVDSPFVLRPDLSLWLHEHIRHQHRWK